MSATTLTNPEDVAVDPTSGKVFVSDRRSSRVLRFPSEAALSNGSAAEVVFGQDSFQTSTPNFPNGSGNGANASGLDSPLGLTVDEAGRLWVADALNSRILMWTDASDLGNNAPANLVLGQNDFASQGSGSAVDQLQIPFDVCVDSAGNLWVADYFNNRVLRFADAANLANGAAASQVIDFVSSGFANSLAGPSGVSVDLSGRLFVVDQSHNRVVAYEDAANRGNGSEADLVIGQPDFDSEAAGSGIVGLSTPTAVEVDTFGALWVVDLGNNRILRYDEIASQDNRPRADAVVGQSSFFTDSRGLGRNQFNTPGGIFLSPAGNLWVADASNNRVLRFTRPVTPPTLTPAPTPAVGRRRLPTRRFVVARPSRRCASASWCGGPPAMPPAWPIST